MRDLVIVSGYYGFDNLGDEAILEQVLSELKRIVASESIVVLSANPAKTARQFQVRAELRTDLRRYAALCQQARLFVSGGGGLFQNTKSLNSVLFYAAQVLVAKACGAKVIIYAQGIGPLHGQIAQWFTRQAFALADIIAVRDALSSQLLDRWALPAIQTADPVWCLESQPLPKALQEQLNGIPAQELIGLSLRTSHNFSEKDLDELVAALGNSLPENAHIILLPLQASEDKDLLAKFADKWNQRGRQSTLIDTAALEYPSQWISLFGRCKLVVAMRLHALIMALKAGVAVAGLAYDPKVSQVLTEFEQPILILAKERQAGDWEQLLKTALADRDHLSQNAMKKAEGAKKLACQNFHLLARILDTQA